MVPRATPVAPADGETDVMVGAVVSKTVVNDQVLSAAKALPARSIAAFHQAIDEVAADEAGAAHQ